MITAKEAKNKSDNTLESLALAELVRIEKLINEAISKGEYSISYSPSMKAKTRQELERLGYKITISIDPRDSWSVTYISWDKI